MDVADSAMFSSVSDNSHTSAYSIFDGMFLLFGVCTFATLSFGRSVGSLPPINGTNLVVDGLWLGIVYSEASGTASALKVCFPGGIRLENSTFLRSLTEALVFCDELRR